VARKLRVQYPGAICHVMNRGDRREPIFADDSDRELFFKRQRYANMRDRPLFDSGLYRGFPNGFQTRQPSCFRGPADLEVGDTAGLEACATRVGRHAKKNWFKKVQLALSGSKRPAVPGCRHAESGVTEGRGLGKAKG